MSCTKAPRITVLSTERILAALKDIAVSIRRVIMALDLLDLSHVGITTCWSNLTRLDELPVIQLPSLLGAADWKSMSRSLFRNVPASMHQRVMYPTPLYSTELSSELSSTFTAKDMMPPSLAFTFTTHETTSQSLFPGKA